MKLSNIVLLTIGLLSFSSCSKVLDLEPEFDLDAGTRFNTLDDYQYSLIGTYSLFRSTSYYGATDGSSNAYGLLPDLLSDNLIETAESLGNERVFSRWAYAADEPQILGTWVAAYRIIAQANLTLRNIDRFAANDPERVNSIKGQALAIRGMVHFDILRYWADDYSRNSGEPGIPYVTEFNYEQKPARGTVKETYDKIEADLLEAKDLLQNAGINNSNRAYIDAGVVNAMLARMYLYAGEWNQAIEYATYVIDEFPLANPANFPKIWTDAATDEVIWSVVFEAGQGTVGTHAYFPQVNASQYRPAPALRLQYDPVNDVRYNAYFDTVANSSGNLRIVLSKYLAKEAQLTDPDAVVNFKAFRTGEMYLIRAEAYARTGKEGQALADLNTLRAARIAGFTPGTETGAALLDAIALERRKELLAEGHRFFDLKRTTRLVERPNCTDFCTLTPDDREWTWPIPQAELDANPNLRPQNPGY